MRNEKTEMQPFTWVGRKKEREVHYSKLVAEKEYEEGKATALQLSHQNICTCRAVL